MEFDCLALELQQLFSVQWKTAIFVWAAVSVYYFTHGCKIVKAPMSMFCLATIYRQREILYKSVSDIPVCPRLAVKVWLVWSWPYQFYVFYCTSQSHFQGLAISMHAATS